MEFHDFVFGEICDRPNHKRPRLAGDYFDSEMVGGKRIYRCFLCQIEFTPNNIQKHLSGDEHKKNAAQLKDEQLLARCIIKRWNVVKLYLSLESDTDPSSRALTVENHIEMLPSPWKEEMKLKVYDYLLSEEAHFHGWNNSPIYQELEKYESRARLAVLQLAIWKAACLKQMPVIGDNYFAAEQWMKSGWKTQKAEHRSSNDIGIIVSAVRRFL